MMPPTLYRRRQIAVFALALVAGGTAPAAGQNADVEVHVRLPREVVRDLERLATEAATTATAAVGEALRSIGLGAHALEALAEPAARAGQDRSMRIERSDRTSRTIALGPNGLVELRNVAGNITVTAGSGRDVVVEIVREARARTEADAALGLQQVQVNVDHRGERAAVETVYPRGRNPFQVTTTYTVTAPAGTRVTARSVSGDVTVRGISGDVSVEAVSGSVVVQNAGRITQARAISGDVRLTDIDADGAVSAGTVSGNVVLERVRARRISAESVSGSVRASDVTTDGVTLRSLSGTVEYAGRLAPNGRYEFDSHSGSVRIVVPGDAGFELQARSFSGRIRPEGLTLQAISMDRGQLRATVGNGSAVVIAKTFSGDVIVTRK